MMTVTEIFAIGGCGGRRTDHENALHVCECVLSKQIRIFKRRNDRHIIAGEMRFVTRDNAVGFDLNR